MSTTNAQSDALHVPTTPAHELTVDAALLRSEFPMTQQHRENMAARLERIAAALTPQTGGPEHG